MYSENISVEVLEISKKNLAEKTFKNATYRACLSIPFWIILKILQVLLTFGIEFIDLK